MDNEIEFTDNDFDMFLLPCSIVRDKRACVVLPALNGSAIFFPRALEN